MEGLRGVTRPLPMVRPNPRDHLTGEKDLASRKRLVDRLLPFLGKA
jgi:hypothetical protein